MVKNKHLFVKLQHLEQLQRTSWSTENQGNFYRKLLSGLFESQIKSPARLSENLFRSRLWIELFSWAAPTHILLGTHEQKLYVCVCVRAWVCVFDNKLTVKSLKNKIQTNQVVWRMKVVKIEVLRSERRWVLGEIRMQNVMGKIAPCLWSTNMEIQ